MPLTKADAKRSPEGDAATEQARKRAAMMEGEEWALTLRDKGPERRLVRDIVDARRNLAEYGLYAVFAFVILDVDRREEHPGRHHPGVAAAAMVFAVVIDSMFLDRRIKMVVAAKMPKASLKVCPVRYRPGDAVPPDAHRSRRSIAVTSSKTNPCGSPSAYRMSSGLIFGKGSFRPVTRLGACGLDLCFA